MTRFIFPFLLSFLCLYAYGQRTGKSLSDYVEAAKQYSPLLHDYRNQLQIEQAELRRLKALYTRSRLELNGDYLFVPVLTKDGGRVGRLCHRPAHPSQADDRHRCHPCPDAPRLGAGHGRTDAAAACRGGDRRLRGRSAPAAGSASGADAEDLPMNGGLGVCPAC